MLQTYVIKQDVNPRASFVDAKRSIEFESRNLTESSD